MHKLTGVLARALTTAVGAACLVVPVTASSASNAVAAAKPERMYVAVSVATVWTNPSKARPVDRPALTNPAHPRQWLRAMSPAQSEDLTDSNRTQTQALYGAPVLVLARQGAWSQVVVPNQPTPRDPRGYPGWIPTVQLTRNLSFGAASLDDQFRMFDRATAGFRQRICLLERHLYRRHSKIT